MRCSALSALVVALFLFSLSKYLLIFVMHMKACMSNSATQLVNIIGEMNNADRSLLHQQGLPTTQYSGYMVKLFVRRKRIKPHRIVQQQKNAVSK